MGIDCVRCIEKYIEDIDGDSRLGEDTSSTPLFSIPY